MFHINPQSFSPCTLLQVGRPHSRAFDLLTCELQECYWLCFLGMNNHAVSPCTLLQVDPPPEPPSWPGL